MRHKPLFWMLIALLSLSGPALAELGPFNPATAREEGESLAETVKHFNRPAKDLSTRGIMVLLAGDKITDTRQVAMRQKTEGEVSLHALRFLDSIKRGVTFLTIENQDRDNDQYLYIPALGRARKVALSDKQNAFEDTDFSFEDLGGRKISDYVHERKTDAAFSGRDCFRVESLAKESSAKYPKQLSWIDKENFVPLQVRFFGRDGSLERVIVAGDVRKIQNIHIPFKVVAKDLKARHTTEITLTDALVDTGLDGLSFNRDQMGETWR
ncbi:outer membrane lipoprotein-sorting protein [Desulfobotulus sp.]|uniref:outer membrane lipoprotein-sorting protein n=1 Tax=Desulfobotulus sp. TaxID=1940337 RepID=UPI002A3654A0|nr:outer membrane lipoprotein-sorting protein [Desulfobotulus sp.]MDY0163053.1 outer membrane lipoprotein-sorting protein [Desulfobotulus sp.]